MQLKVWCEKCEGCGQIADCQRMGLDPCPVCTGPDGEHRGFTLVEAVQLAEGRCVVLDKATWQRFVDAVCFTMYDGDPRRLEDAAGPASQLLAAMFTGKVYEAEAVGRCEPRYSYQERCVIIHAVNAAGQETGGRIAPDNASLVAIGLKEVGK
jgi:hypothetical protein